jgi:hypothetical protein
MMRRKIEVVLVLSMLMGVAGCSSSASNVLNPFHSGDDPYVDAGEDSLKPILEEGREGSHAEAARHALEVMGSYRRSQEPQPVYPVVQPAEVRLMWVPDHVNKHGDMVPAHYYYLRVLEDRWAVQDAFELEEQLNAGSKGAGGGTPWVYGETRKR